MPRAAAILIVYFVTLGSIYFSIAAIAPRIYLETAKVHARRAVAGRQVFRPIRPAAGAVGRRRSQPFTGRQRPSTSPIRRRFRIVNKPDGSVDLRVGSGVEVVQQGPGHWRVGPGRAQSREVQGLGPDRQGRERSRRLRAEEWLGAARDRQGRDQRRGARAFSCCS